MSLTREEMAHIQSSGLAFYKEANIEVLELLVISELKSWHSETHLCICTVDNGAKLSKANENTSRLQWILNVAQNVLAYTISVPTICFDYSAITWVF